MTDAITAINTKLSALLDADSDLDDLDLNRIFVGVVYDMVPDYMPCVEITTESRVEESAMTGNRGTYIYDGAFIVSILKQDMLTVTTRVARVPSYDTLVTMMWTIKKLLSNSLYATLEGLTFENGRVVDFIMSQEFELGAARRGTRDSNIVNVGIIPYMVRTIENNDT